MSAYVSVTQLFSLGIGPSSSHTVGPMRAAKAFVDSLDAVGDLVAVDRVECRLFGALAATGVGHGTPDAVIGGLAGLRPEDCDPDLVAGAWDGLGDGATVVLGGHHAVEMRRSDLVMQSHVRLPRHPNALRLAAYATSGSVIAENEYYSVGGGFVIEGTTEDDREMDRTPGLPFPFTNGAELLAACDLSGLSIAEIALANETAMRGARVDADIDRIWAAMVACIEKGLRTDGMLPGGLGVTRRAPALFSRLTSGAGQRERHDVEWLQVYAIAVNEENAAGGRVVTAPTNGAAGIIPAVGRHYEIALAKGRADMRTFLLTAAAVGSLIKANASISGAELGCQGEVGSACAMASAALCAVLGGTPAQVEHAAEIALEHHLGLTCDPVGGLVQIPCIERNGIAAVTAFSAARLALAGDGRHRVSLDTAIETMRQTGMDMSQKYKETATGGLALNVALC